MSMCNVLSGMGKGVVAAICLGVLLLVPQVSLSASPVLVTLISSYGDSTSTVKARAPRADTAVADTSRAAKLAPAWPMDELKRVLKEETGRGAAGGGYTERKSGRVAMMCALLVPGLGQMYDEKPLKSAIALGLETYYLSHVFMNRRYWAREKEVRDSFPAKSYDWLSHDRYVTEYWERSIDWIWWSGAVVFAIVVDAYVDAKLYDMRFRVEPRPAERGVGLSFVVPY